MEGNPRDAVPRGETGFPHPVKRGGSMASTESRHDLKGDEQHLKPDGYLHLYVHIKRILLVFFCVSWEGAGLKLKQNLSGKSSYL